MRNLKLRLCIAFVLLLLVAGAAPIPPKPEPIITNPIIREQRFRKDLVERWAPIHLQDVDRTGADSLGGRADYLAAVNFDGDWRTDNNWENAERFPLRAVVYYSLVATRTHWFIVYAFYHPRDWSDNPNPEVRRSESHENDMEGALVVVKRPTRHSTADFGELQAIITVCHNDFYSYIPQGSSLTAGRETIDGSVTFELDLAGTYRIVTAQEAKTHCLKAYPYVGIRGGDGIKYYPGQRGQEPQHANDRQVEYELIDIFLRDGLWARRNNSETFASPGTFRGDNGMPNRAHAPWGWDDRNDGEELLAGELANDPAKLVSIYFTNLGDFAREYVLNGYQSINGSAWQ